MQKEKNKLNSNLLFGIFLLVGIFFSQYFCSAASTGTLSFPVSDWLYAGQKITVPLNLDVTGGNLGGWVVDIVVDPTYIRIDSNADITGGNVPGSINLSNYICGVSASPPCTSAPFMQVARVAGITANNAVSGNVTLANINLTGVSASGGSTVIKVVPVQLIDSSAADFSPIPNILNNNITSSPKTSQIWQDVGSNISNGHPAWHTSIALDNQNTPYVAYSDQTDSGRIVVKKFNSTNGSWLPVGSQLTTGAGESIALAINPDPANNFPYVAYADVANSSHISVKRFDGFSWIAMNPLIFGAASNISLAFNPITYELIVAYRIGGFDFYVQKFNKNSGAWDYVGADKVITANIVFSDLVLDSSGNPYIALDMDDGNGNPSISVMHFNGSEWISVGNTGASTIYDEVSLALDPITGDPYLAYTDGASPYNIKVIKYANSAWTQVGQFLSVSGGKSPALKFNQQNNFPYVVYNEIIPNKLNVKYFDGNSWVLVGEPNFSKSYAYWPSIMFDSTGILYAAFSDFGDGNNSHVMKLVDNLVGTYNLTAFVSLLSNWLKTGTTSDLNADNIVNTRDLGIMMSKWN